MFRKLEWKAILAGVISDIGGTILIGFVYIAVMTFKYIDQLKAGLSTPMTSPRPIDYIFWLIMGSACSILGGLVAAKVARQSPYLNSIASALVVLALGSFLINGETPVWYSILPYIVTIPLFLFGSWLTVKHTKTHHYTS